MGNSIPTNNHPSGGIYDIIRRFQGVKRMAKLTFKEELCKGCGLCVTACPKKILAISKTKLNHKGHAPVELTKPEECVGCASCAMMCPDCVITVER